MFIITFFFLIFFSFLKDNKIVKGFDNQKDIVDRN